MSPEINKTEERSESHPVRNTILVLIVIFAFIALMAWWSPWSSKSDQQATVNNQENVVTPDVQQQNTQQQTTSQSSGSGASQNQANLSATGITFENSDQLFFDNGLGGYNAVVFPSGLVAEPVGVMGCTIDGRYFAREAEVNMVRPKNGAKLKMKGNATCENNEWKLKPTELKNGYYIYQAPEKSPIWISDKGVTEFCFQFTTEKDQPLPAGHIPHLFKNIGAKVSSEIM